MEVTMKHDTLAGCSSSGHWLLIAAVATGAYVTTILATCITEAGAVRALVVGQATTIHLGPLQFFHIYKTALAQGGYTLEFQCKPGLGVLALACIATFLIGGIFRARRP